MIRTNSNEVQREPQGKEKWSKRMEKVFTSRGIRWTTSLEAKVKTLVSGCVPTQISNINDVVIPQKNGFIDSVAEELEKMITE